MKMNGYGMEYCGYQSLGQMTKHPCQKRRRAKAWSRDV
jgi:hypothetical protein